MSDKINIEAILEKYTIGFPKNLSLLGRARKSELKAAMKEAIEAVIDKCAKNVKLGKRYPGIGMDAITIVDKESILKIKNEINYD